MELFTTSTFNIFGTLLLLLLLLLLLFSCSAISDSLWHHGLQHASFPRWLATPGACSNSCPSSQRCHLTISSCRPLLLLPSIFPSIRVFSNELTLPIRWPKYCNLSFGISPSNEYSGLISFRTDWFGRLPNLREVDLCRIFPMGSIAKSPLFTRWTRSAQYMD